MLARLERAFEGLRVAKLGSIYYAFDKLLLIRQLSRRFPSRKFTFNVIEFTNESELNKTIADNLLLETFPVVTSFETYAYQKHVKERLDVPPLLRLKHWSLVFEKDPDTITKAIAKLKLESAYTAADVTCSRQPTASIKERLSQNAVPGADLFDDE